MFFKKSLAAITAKLSQLDHRISEVAQRAASNDRFSMQTDDRVDEIEDQLKALQKALGIRIERNTANPPEHPRYIAVVERGEEPKP